MLKEYIKLAYQKPHLRSELLPIIKLAMEFSSKEELEEYLKDHPNADPKKHSVKESESKPKKLSAKTKEEIETEVTKAANKAKESFNHAQPKDFIQHLRMHNSVNEMVSKVKKMKWDPTNKKIPKEMKQACEAIKSRSYFGRALLTGGVGYGVAYGGIVSGAAGLPIALPIAAAVKANPVLAAKIGVKAAATFGPTGLAVGAGLVMTATLVAGTVFAMKKVVEHFDKKDKEQERKMKAEDNVSEVAFDIFMDKYTPVEINNQYKNKTDDIVKKISEKKIEPEEALKEIEKLEKEYKEKVIPGIEKALTSSGWKKNDKGEYSFEDKEFEKTYDSFFKKAKDEDENMFLKFKYLKNRVKEIYAIKKSLENPKLLSKAIIEVIEENS